MHEFHLGVIADQAAYAQEGSDTSKLKALLEKVVSLTSHVYEMQFDIKLKIGRMTMYTDSRGPAFASGCAQSNPTLDKLDKLTAETNEFFGATHLFTGCGTGRGVVGVAWKGTMCLGRTHQGDVNTGVNELHKEDDWLTFAHELGHNFNGDHSFEQGQGRTGGIMDYGDGKLNGEFQFNSKYRKQPMCSYFSTKVNHCQGKFQLDTGGEGGGDTGGGEGGGSSKGKGKGGKGKGS